MVAVGVQHDQIRLPNRSPNGIINNSGALMWLGVVQSVGRGLRVSTSRVFQGSCPLLSDSMVINGVSPLATMRGVVFFNFRNIGALN